MLIVCETYIQLSARQGLRAKGSMTGEPLRVAALVAITRKTHGPRPGARPPPRGSPPPPPPSERNRRFLARGAAAASRRRPRVEARRRGGARCPRAPPRVGRSGQGRAEAAEAAAAGGSPGGGLARAARAWCHWRRGGCTATTLSMSATRSALSRALAPRRPSTSPVETTDRGWPRAATATSASTITSSPKSSKQPRRGGGRLARWRRWRRAALEGGAGARWPRGTS